MSKRIRGLSEADDFENFDYRRRRRASEFDDQTPTRRSNKGSVKASKESVARSTPGWELPRSYSIRELTVGRIIVAKVAYSDGSGFKSRPCVVCKVVNRSVFVLPITSSQTRFKYPGIDIEPNEFNGLVKSCRVQGRVTEIDRVCDIEGSMGYLEGEKLKACLLNFEHLDTGHSSGSLPDCILCAAELAVSLNVAKEVAAVKKATVTHTPSPAQVALWVNRAHKSGNFAPGLKPEGQLQQ